MGINLEELMNEVDRERSPKRVRKASESVKREQTPELSQSLADQVWAEMAGEQIAGTPIEKIPQQLITEEGQNKPTGLTSQSSPRDMRRDLTEAGRIAIPTATQMGAGMIRGGPTGALLGGLYGVSKEVVGGLGGLGLIKALGMEPSQADVLATVGGPAAVKGIERTLRPMARMAPGIQAAEQQELVPGLRQAPDKFLPRGQYGTTQLYDEAYALGGVPTPLSETSMTMKHLMGKEKQLSAGYKADDGTMKLLKGTEDLASRPAVDFNVVRDHVQRLSAKIRGREAEDETKGIMVQTRNALMRDMDAAAQHAEGPVGEALRDANKEWRKQMARDDLSYVINKSGVTPSPGSNLYTVHPSRVKKWVESPDQAEWRASVGRDGVKSFVQFLDDIAPYEKSLKGGLRFEAMRLGGSVGGFAGTGLGAAMGGGFGAMAGGAGGSVAGTYMMEHLGEWFLSPKGQGVVRNLLKFSRGNWSTKEASALTTAMVRTIGNDPLPDKVVKGIWEEQP